MTRHTYGSRALSITVLGGRDEGQKSEVRSQRSEVRGQKSEVRGQKSEVRSQRSEVRGQRSERMRFESVGYRSCGVYWFAFV